MHSSCESEPVLSLCQINEYNDDADETIEICSGDGFANESI